MGEFHNVDELKNIFEFCGFYAKLEKVIKLEEGIKFELFEGAGGESFLNRSIRESKIKTSTLVKLLMYKDNMPISTFYFYGGNPAKLAQLDNRNGQLDNLNLEDEQIVKLSDQEKISIIHHEIELKNVKIELKNDEIKLRNDEIILKNCKAFYQGLCLADATIQFESVWKKIESQPIVYQLSNDLYNKLVDSIGGKKRTLPQISIDNTGKVNIILPQALAEDAEKKALISNQKDFFDKTFKPMGKNGERCAEFSNANKLKGMLSFYNVRLDSTEKLYRELCQRYDFHFENISEVCKETNLVSSKVFS